jgi:hypothetical protein
MKDYRASPSDPDPGGYPVPLLEELPPPDVPDPLIAAYILDVDRTLLRENLALDVNERFERFLSFLRSIEGLRGSAWPAADEPDAH